MRYALHSFYFFFFSLVAVPSANNNKKLEYNYRSPEIDIVLVLNQLIIHVLQAGISKLEILPMNFAMYIEYKMPLIVVYGLSFC